MHTKMDRRSHRSRKSAEVFKLEVGETRLDASAVVGGSNCTMKGHVVYAELCS